MKKSGDLGKCIAISDVSGSMAGIPMQVSIALGLVISELAHPAFRNYLLTFSEYPEWHKVVGETYYDKLQSILCILSTQFSFLYHVTNESSKFFLFLDASTSILCIGNATFIGFFGAPASC